MERESLIAIYDRYKGVTGGGDKGTRHSYIEEYAKLFDPIREEVKIFLEIGVYRGHSMALWRDYFHNATCIGVDITNRAFIQEYVEGCEIIIGDATKPETFKNVKNLDIVIDDGSHKLNDQLKTFQLLFPKLSDKGIYIIEDIQDLESERQEFINLHSSVNIIDLRKVKDRYDDVLVVYKHNAD